MKTTRANPEQLLGQRSSLLHYKTDYRKITPTKDNILVADMNFGERISKGGVIMIDDDKKAHGIRPRWARVISVGPKQVDVAPGEWILVAHGRWTRGLDMTDDAGETVTVRLVDPKEIIMATDEMPTDDTIANTVS
jgi:co-chaperonin GroES (HSP10)